jgi:hypothetical protein
MVIREHRFSGLLPGFSERSKHWLCGALRVGQVGSVALQLELDKVAMSGRKALVGFPRPLSPIGTARLEPLWAGGGIPEGMGRMQNGIRNPVAFLTCLSHSMWCCGVPPSVAASEPRQGIPFRDNAGALWFQKATSYSGNMLRFSRFAGNVPAAFWFPKLFGFVRIDLGPAQVVGQRASFPLVRHWE